MGTSQTMVLAVGLAGGVFAAGAMLYVVAAFLRTELFFDDMKRRVAVLRAERARRLANNRIIEVDVIADAEVVEVDEAPAERPPS